MMDLAQQRYYKINKMFMSALGIWPYQSRGSRYAKNISFGILITSQLIPQLIAVVKFSDDPDIIVQSLSPIVTVVACITKGVNIMFNIDKIFKFLEHMRVDWMILVNEPEIDIIHDYAQVGRQFTVAYTTGLFLTWTIFMWQPALPAVLNDLNFINGTAPAKLPYPVHYGIDLDQEKYYYYMFMHVNIVSGVGVAMIIAADTMFLVFVQHACGMFTAVGYTASDRLASLTDTPKPFGFPMVGGAIKETRYRIKSRLRLLETEEQLKLRRLARMKRMANSREQNDELRYRAEADAAFQYVVICIENHKKAIELGDLIEASHTWAFFSFVGFNMIMISITGYQMVVNMDKNPEEAIRFATFTIAQMVHLFFQSYFSQKLKDHSEQVREYVYQADWYSTSHSTQKLLNFVIMRTNAPCQLTAGKIFPMSVASFTSVMKTSMSYFTLLRSMQ